jgi:hypothetical protein
LIDDGKNPDEFTRAVLNSCIAKNQITKGKTDASRYGNIGGASIFIELVNGTVVFEHFMCLIELGF